MWEKIQVAAAKAWVGSVDYVAENPANATAMLYGLVAVALVLAVL